MFLLELEQTAGKERIIKSSKTKNAELTNKHQYKL